MVFTIIFLSMYARLGAVDGFESEGRSGSERTHIFGSGYIDDPDISDIRIFSSQELYVG